MSLLLQVVHCMPSVFRRSERVIFSEGVLVSRSPCQRAPLFTFTGTLWYLELIKITLRSDVV
jgi:hypothetical protein